MNKYIALCYDEMEGFSREIKRINRIINERIKDGDYENSLAASKELVVLNTKKQTISVLIAKMEQVD